MKQEKKYMHLPIKRTVAGLAALIGVFLLVKAYAEQQGFAVAYAQGANCCTQGPGDPDPNASQELKPSSSEIDPARISFYAVPLVCPAAREIGCGSRSKPVLREIEHAQGVQAAWLNRSGTVIAVQWSGGSTTAQQATAIAAVSRDNEVSMLELRGRRRETVLKEFSPTVNWYNSSGVDRLSEEEADIIGARFVRRVRATITLSDKEADGLANAVGTAIKHRFLGTSTQSAEEGVLNAGRDYLDEKGLSALKRAFLLGYEPLTGEK
jgi:hypothetical protein